jgi:hypothetical protein
MFLIKLVFINFLIKLDMNKFLNCVTMFAIVAMVSVMADTASGQSSVASVNADYSGTYAGICSNVVMNKKSVPNASATFVVKPVSGTQYRFDGTVHIEVDDPPFDVVHNINFSNLIFSVDDNGNITYVSGGGTVQVIIDDIPVGTFAFNVTAFTGNFTGNALHFDFAAVIPVFFEIIDFTASFSFDGTK